MSPRPFVAVGAGLVCALLAGACVTEKSPPRGFRSGTKEVVEADKKQRARSGATPGALGSPQPAGSVALPAGPESMSVSRVVVGVRPIGAIEYDGQVLPIASPDGRFLAVEEGEAPTWEALLASPKGEDALGTRVAMYDLTASPASRVEPVSPLPNGLMLGRGASHRGFLVESPREDASRWIGLVAWGTGGLEWLVHSAEVNAHAVFTSEGDLLYVRRPIDGTTGTLVLRRPDGQEFTRDAAGRSYEFPLTTGDPSVVYALVRAGESVELEALRLTEDPANAGKHRLGPIIARRELARSPDPATAYQVAASAQSALPLHAVSGDAPDPRSNEPLALMHPAMGRMVVFDLSTSSFVPLAARSFAAARWTAPDARGYFCSTPDGLVFTPEPAMGVGAGQREPTARRAEARVLAGPYVVRATTSAQSPLLVFGPWGRDPRRLEVTAVCPGAGGAPPPAHAGSSGAAQAP